MAKVGCSSTVSLVFPGPCLLDSPHGRGYTQTRTARRVRTNRGGSSRSSKRIENGQRRARRLVIVEGRRSRCPHTALGLDFPANSCNNRVWHRYLDLPARIAPESRRVWLLKRGWQWQNKAHNINSTGYARLACTSRTTWKWATRSSSRNSRSLWGFWVISRVNPKVRCPS